MPEFFEECVTYDALKDFEEEADNVMKHRTVDGLIEHCGESKHAIYTSDVPTWTGSWSAVSSVGASEILAAVLSRSFNSSI